MFSPARNQQSRGIMLHEVLFVLAAAILGLFAVSLSFVRIPSCRNYNVHSAKSHVAMLEDAVNLYVLAVGKCPTATQGLEALLAPPHDLEDPCAWAGPYLDKFQLPVDPWNNAYQYQAISDQTFRIWSNGPDGIAATKDDITAP